jgi:uncharacterized membrane protein
VDLYNYIRLLADQRGEKKKMNISEIKQRAKNILAVDHWGYVGYILLAGFIMSALVALGAYVFFVGGIVATVLVAYPVSIGTIRLIMRKRNTGIIQMDDMFSGYKVNFGNTILVLFMKDLFVSLWTLLFIVPGIIKRYQYCMVSYIVAENPNMHYRDALEMSRKMTDGKKMDIFVLQLTFIGWFLLSALTLGILGICYVNPYYTLAMQECYFYLKYMTFGDVDPLAQNFNGQYTGQFVQGYQQSNYNQNYQNQGNYSQNTQNQGNYDQNTNTQNQGNYDQNTNTQNQGNYGQNTNTQNQNNGSDQQ